MTRNNTGPETVQNIDHSQETPQQSGFMSLVNATLRANLSDLVKLNIDNGWVLLCEWRECLNLSREEVADKLGVPVAAIEIFEKRKARLRKTTIAQLATTHDLKPEKSQLNP